MFQPAYKAQKTISAPLQPYMIAISAYLKNTTKISNCYGNAYSAVFYSDKPEIWSI